MGGWFFEQVKVAHKVDGEPLDIAARSDAGRREPASGAASTPDRLFEGVAAYDAFGISVASAGGDEIDGWVDHSVGPLIGSPGARAFSRIASALRVIALHPWCPMAQSAASVGAPVPRV